MRQHYQQFRERLNGERRRGYAERDSTNRPLREQGMQGMLGEELRLECERIVRDVETRVERFMVIEDGQEPTEMHDGVLSVLLGRLAGKSVQIEIHVQPDLDDDYWTT